MKQQIEQSLSTLFNDHRVVVWIDETEEMRAAFEQITLPDVEKVVVDNNEFGLKYRLLRDAPAQKFLLYRPGPHPPPPENWLLDLEQAFPTFQADQFTLWLTALHLPPEWATELAAHRPFFESARRRERLGRLLDDRLTLPQVQLRMTAVCAQADPHLDEIVRRLLAELAAGETERIDLIDRCGLADFLWRRVEGRYGYRSEKTSPLDLMLTLFKQLYHHQVHAAPLALSGDARVFMKQWQDSGTHRETFMALSAQAAERLDIAADLRRLDDYRPLLHTTLFEAVEKELVGRLADGLRTKRLPGADVRAAVRRRETDNPWFARYKNLYRALDKTADFIDRLESVDRYISSPGAGIDRYRQEWYRLDQLYRQAFHAMQQVQQMGVLTRLRQQLEEMYTVRFLRPINDEWQQQINRLDRWAIDGQMPQSAVYDKFVRPYLDQNKKLFVIISDGLRYEVGAELLDRIRREDRYDGELSAVYTLLPSYTQLGMAALLPHEQLAIDDDLNTVLVDGHRSAGTENRAAILARARQGRATAVQADAFLPLSRDEARALTRDHDLIYLYHNRIDAAGDDRDRETDTFTAVAEALDELVKLVKKLTAANANNILITADHGFLYQDELPADNLYLDDAPQAERSTRRYLLGRTLPPTDGFIHFTAVQVGLAAGPEMLLPKSLDLLRKRGSGRRYLHGGATLQEIVVPVLAINKKRHDDVRLVDVSILSKGRKRITTNQFSAAFYQEAWVTAKVQARTLTAGLYTSATPDPETLISNSVTLQFDATAQNGREREQRAQFVLTSEASRFNDQTVYLHLFTESEQTTHLEPYRHETYRLQKSIGADFDLF